MAHSRSIDTHGCISWSCQNISDLVDCDFDETTPSGDGVMCDSATSFWRGETVAGVTRKIELAVFFS